MSATKTATMLEVWGFSTILVASPQTTDDLPAKTMDSINNAARERGIHPGQPSDALDLSRDIIIDEALAPAPWSIVNNALCVAYGGAPLHIAEDAARE